MVIGTGDNLRAVRVAIELRHENHYHDYIRPNRTGI